MTYDWDKAKSETNRRRRGFGFEIVEGFRWDLSLGPEVQHVEGEERDFWIGPIGTHLYALATTERGEATRVISLRHASNAEIRR